MKPQHVPCHVKEVLATKPDGLRFKEICNAIKQNGCTATTGHINKTLSKMVQTSELTYVLEYVSTRQQYRKPGCNTARRYKLPIEQAEHLEASSQ